MPDELKREEQVWGRIIQQKILNPLPTPEEFERMKEREGIGKLIQLEVWMLNDGIADKEWDDHILWNCALCNKEDEKLLPPRPDNAKLYAKIYTRKVPQVRAQSIRLEDLKWIVPSTSNTGEKE